MTGLDGTQRVDADSRAIASCTCGRVVLVAMGKSIVSAVCYCKSCQAAGRILEGSPSAPPVLGQDGGTEYVLYRKDRVRLVQGRNISRNTG